MHYAERYKQNAKRLLGILFSLLSAYLDVINQKLTYIRTYPLDLGAS